MCMCMLLLACQQGHFRCHSRSHCHSHRCSHTCTHLAIYLSIQPPTSPPLPTHPPATPTKPATTTHSYPYPHPPTHTYIYTLTHTHFYIHTYPDDTIDIFCRSPGDMGSAHHIDGQGFCIAILSPLDIVIRPTVHHEDACRQQVTGRLVQHVMIYAELDIKP